MRTIIRYAVTTVLALALAVPGQAQVLLDTGLGNETTFRSANSGPGQGVAVGVDTDLTRFGFYIGTPQGANVKFMIWDGLNSTLLFSQAISVGPTANGTLTLSDPFAFALSAGQTYHFGIIADNNLNVSFFFPQVGHSENGLTLVGNNTNYSNFANPTPAAGGLAHIALVLEGRQGAAVPEPLTLLLMATGLAGVAASRRPRRRNIEEPA